MITAPFTIVNVEPDTDEWLEERRNSIGASEIAAVMGLSPYATPLDIYKNKHGIDRPFDEILGFIGHQSEAIMHAWVEKFSGLGVKLIPGYMARSVQYPFLHATFDRITDLGDIVQMKTAHQYTGHHWDEGIPTDIRVQVQGEMLISGRERALVVVWIGGREFRLFWEPRDDRFIQQQMLPTLQTFWEQNVLAGVAPEPSTLAENAEIYPSEHEEIEASDTAIEAVERRAVLLSDIQSQQEEADALRLVIANYMGTADTLMHNGRKVLTNRSQKGRTGFDKAGLAADHPDLIAKYTTIGQPFKVMRTITQKETTK